MSKQVFKHESDSRITNFCHQNYSGLSDIRFKRKPKKSMTSLIVTFRCYLPADYSAALFKTLKELEVKKAKVLIFKVPLETKIFVIHKSFGCVSAQNITLYMNIVIYTLDIQPIYLFLSNKMLLITTLHNGNLGGQHWPWPIWKINLR